MHPQIPLDLGPQQLTFNNFWRGENSTLFEVVARIARGQGNDAQLFINGIASSGKTHLMIAACQHATENGYRVAYLSGHMIDNEAALQGYDRFDLVCVDDLQLMPNLRGGELALFGLINGLRQNGGRLLMCADAPLTELGIELGDLHTRVSWGANYTLKPVLEEQFVDALLMRAEYLGLKLKQEVVNYLSLRCTREFSTLVELLTLLNAAAMQTQRKITVPFVREVLASEHQLL